MIAGATRAYRRVREGLYAPYRLPGFVLLAIAIGIDRLPIAWVECLTE